jgi:hypothetical protein
MATTATSSSAALQVAPVASPVCLDGTSPPRPVSVATSSSKLNLGSLLRLFKSEFFGAWLAVSYLYKVSEQLVERIDSRTFFFHVVV